jgi:hypothetical protein
MEVNGNDLEWSPVKMKHFFKVLIGDFTCRLVFKFISFIYNLNTVQRSLIRLVKVKPEYQIHLIL